MQVGSSSIKFVKVVVQVLGNEHLYTWLISVTYVTTISGNFEGCAGI